MKIGWAERIISTLGSAHPAAKHRGLMMLHEPLLRPRIGDRDSAAALFAPTFAGLAHEALRVAYLDGGLALLRLWKGDEADAASVDVPLRTLIRDALILGAHALIVAHNHPQGDPTPSRADKAVTRRLVEIARPLDIRIVDHLIFAGEQVASFRGLGLL